METYDNPGPRRVIVPREWATFYEETNIPAAIRVGDTLRLTGHTGETSDGEFSADLDTQIRQTFLNIDLTLTEAGVKWSDVVEINSYHVGLWNQSETVLRVAAEFFEAPFPAWTAVGVTELIYPQAMVEIRCVAVLPRQK
jgi:enamine deaminase RidA (YjgF/YER057c/UK114 family)